MAQVRQDNVQIKLEIDGSQSRTELDNLTRKADVLKESMKGLKKGSEEYVNANKELSTVNARMKELRDEIGLTSLSTNQLGALSRQLARELANLTPETESFINKAQELADVNARLDFVRQGAKGVKEEIAQAGGGVMDFIKKAAGFAGIQLGVQAVVSGLKQLASESITAATEGSDSIADMEKSLNLTTEGAKALREQLQGIDTRTAEKDLEGIAVAGGQLGVAAADVDEFTESVDQAVVALGDEFSGGVEQVTKSIGGLQKLYKDTADLKPDEAITKIGSALNALGADGSATAPVIADFTARIGQLGDLAPEISQTLGLGAAFQELGLSAEISSGGLTNILLTAAKDTAGFGKQIGLTSDEFQQLINTDPNEVILRLAASLKGASETEIISTLEGLNIKSQEAVKVISLLANQTDIVRQKQALAAAEYEKGTSLTDEFAKKNTNAAAEVAKAEKSFAQFRLELGEQLIPIYIRVLQYGGLLLNVLKALPGFVSENKTAFGLLALAVLAFNAEQIKAQATTLGSLALQKLVALGVVVETEGKYSLITATELQTAAQTGLNAALVANPIGIIITLLALFAFGLKQLYDRSETFRGAVNSLFVMLKPLGALFGQLGSYFAPVLEGFRQLFGSFSSGKGPLEAFGAAMAISVVLPIKLMIANVQLAVDGLGLLIEAGKRVANFFGADFEVDSTAFDNFTAHAKANAKSIFSTLTGQDGADAAQAAQAQRLQDSQQELATKLRQLEQAQAQKQALEQKAAADKKAADAKNDLEALKEREANIKAALALVASGSAEELRLKKLEIIVKRDIDLLGEKKTEGDRKVIRAEALRDLRDLQDDYNKKTKDAAEKVAKEQADVEKKIADLKAGLLKDETEKRIQQLTAAAEKEKATAKGTAQQIAQQQQLIEEKLALDVAELRRARAQKDALDLLEIQRLNNSLIRDDFDRHKAELYTAHEAANLKILDSDVNAAAKRKANDDALTQGLIDNDLARAAKHREIEDSITDIENETEDQRLENRLKKAGISRDEQEKILAAQLVRKLLGLTKSEEQEMAVLDDQLAKGEISEEEYARKKQAIHENYLAKKEAASAAAAQSESERNKADIEEKLGYASQFIQAVADFQKIASDKELAKVEKDKKARLAKLDAEYKAGTVSKESYEAQKASIEANYDDKTRAIKQEAAQKEKEYNIAQAIIQGVLAVLKAAPNVPLQIATGVMAAASVAKIIATPIPEFALGGVAGGAKPTWRERVRQFATGGRINSRAGVADVGQRHSGGGIRMVDGATGEHLGEWERGEPYMILSRDTYANNKDLVDSLIDTSLYRGGAPVRQRPSGYYEDGGVPGGQLPTVAAGANNAGQELVQAVRETRDAVRALPSRQYVAWGQEDTAELEDRLNERAGDRRNGEIR